MQRLCLWGYVINKCLETWTGFMDYRDRVGQILGSLFDSVILYEHSIDVS